MRVVEGRATVADVDSFVADLTAVEERHGVTVQAFDGRYVVGRDHLARAVELADRAIRREENVARDRAVEVLLYAAGRRQIDQALEMGVGEGEGPVVVVVDGDGDEAGAAEEIEGVVEPGETLGEFDPERVRSFFEIGEAELAATDAPLSALVLERVALLAVER